MIATYYRCKRCGWTSPNQLKVKCHVYIEHGIAWRSCLKWVKRLSPHDNLGELETVDE